MKKIAILFMLLLLYNIAVAQSTGKVNTDTVNVKVLFIRVVTDSSALTEKQRKVIALKKQRNAALRKESTKEQTNNQNSNNQN